jgi:hypothetical protein
MHFVVDRHLLAVMFESYIEADGAVNVVAASGKVARFEACKL